MIFNNKLLPYLLLAPQIVITVIFFFLPAGQAIYQSVLIQDAFGLGVQFVWFENFQAVFEEGSYLETVRTTVIFSLAVTALSMVSALVLASQADKAIRGSSIYKTLLIWPYAVAPAVAAVLWVFIFQPSIGVLAQAMNSAGLDWDYRLNGTQAMLLVILAASWKQVSYNFLFFLAGLQSIPRSVVEAASIDGAHSTRRFWTILFPLITPTTFFLLLVNIVYAFFGTFGVIHAMTQGGPGQATTTMIYKVYVDGVQNLDLGGSSAQSVILMIVVIALTAVQFRYIERRVHY
ncbi:MAG TPA: sn-glycerol-3-phosphate ABC transporter permease UgpA [Deinococcales bacterium]|nr:sn-glycerol-3-phosphate ABC transporter permease UgpA [Deinococcales bacterium]